MSEIFVSASKRSQDRTEIPQKITGLPLEEIEFGNAQSAADVLQQSGEVFVQKSQMGGGSPMIRGFSANSVLLAMDGIRLNNAIFRSGNLHNVISIDANTIQDSEIIFGPGSVMYGSDALGGVMNFQTKEPDITYVEGKSTAKVNSLARYASANNERTLHTDVNLGREHWGAVTSITYSHFGDLRAGKKFYDRYPDWGRRDYYVSRSGGRDVVVKNEDASLQRYSGYEQLNAMQKIRYRPSHRWNFDYDFHFSTTSDIPRYDRLIERENRTTGPFENSEWFYGPQIWMINAFTAIHYTDTPLFDRMKTTFSHQWFQESRNDRKFQDSLLRNREENVNVSAVTVNFDKQWDDTQELFYGFDLNHNKVSSRAGTLDINTGEHNLTSTRYPDGGSNYNQWAGYLKYQQEISNRLTAIGGTRYSHTFLAAKFDNDSFYDFPFAEIAFDTGALTGSLGLTYRPVSELQLNINASSGFRAPNVDDVAKIFDSEPGRVVVPNDNLKPEYSYNFDFAVIAKVEDLFHLELNSFYTRHAKCDGSPEF